MKIEVKDSVLRISEIPELNTNNSRKFLDRIGKLPDSLNIIEIDLARTVFVDSCGLGALISLHKTAAGHNGGIPIRLLNPTPPVQQLIELTQMHRLFEVVKSGEV